MFKSEHIIRSEDELNRIRKYIIENLMHWDEDENNQAGKGDPAGRPYRLNKIVSTWNRYPMTKEAKNRIRKCGGRLPKIRL